MVDIIKNLVDEKVIATLLILLGIAREIRLFLKIILQYKIEIIKLNEKGD
ncbi:hypothetical protein KG091_07910 [Carnobacteriaceae bacterium zg-ZUI78]|nr:hypothetical protein [Carnobacteriaceae bacterium zg-ZUI78]